MTERNMYKRIGTFNFSTYSFIPEIELEINNYAEILLEELTYSLFKKSIIIDSNCEYSEADLKVLNSVINQVNYFEVNIEKEMALMLLSQILQMELESFLKVPIKELEENKKQIPKLMFEKFMASSDKKTVDDLGLSEMLLEDTESTLEFERYPKYFKLYRARNIILRKFNKRNYSSKTLSKTVQNIHEEFKQGIYLIIIKKNYKELKDNNRNNILLKLIKEYISQFLNNQRLVKTMEKGEYLVKRLDVQLKENNTIQIIFDEFKDKFKENFKKTLQVEYYIEFSKEIISTLEKKLPKTDLDSEKLMVGRFSDYKMFILSEIFKSNSNVEELIKKGYKNYTDEMKCATVKKVLEDNLSLCDFEIAIRVNNLSIEEKLFSKSLTEDIGVVSHILFKSWQYKKYEEMDLNIEPTLLDIPENEKIDSVWFIVKNVRCGKKDTDLAYSLAKEKLLNYLEIMYYFVSKEDENKFKILDPYVLLNITSRNSMLGRKDSPYNKPKNIDDFTDELLKFLKMFLDSQKRIGFDVSSCIRLYFKMINEKSIVAKSRFLVEIWGTIFKTQDINKLATYCSIIIAGTNYNSSDITYKDMRKIMYEHFREFISISREGQCVLLIEEIFDRFKVFTKNIIGTYLFNIPYKDSKEYFMTDILEWIIYINPSDEFISRGAMKND